MNLIKEFFYFTKFKLIVFILVALFLYFFLAQQDAELGNFTWSGFALTLVVVYLFLSILDFSFKDMRHFVIGLIAFILLSGSIWISTNYSTQKKQAAYDKCIEEVKLAPTSTQATVLFECMGAKGYKFYR